MKRATLIYLLIFILLGGAAIYLYMNNKKSTLPEALTDFAVEDTASVTRIIIEDKREQKAELTRQSPGLWMINGKYEVKKAQIDLLLEALKRVEVKEPVAAAARDNVIKELATGAVKVQVYSGKDLIKSFYVGGTTPDELGTMMLLSGSSEPYVTHIPGFNGYLTPRYFAAVNDWRAADLYKLDPTYISEIKIEYPTDPSSSFRLTAQEGQYKVYPAAAATAVEVDPLRAKQYLVLFTKLTYEGLAQLKKEALDSVLASQPMAVLSVKSSSPEKVETIRLYRKAAERRTKEVEGDNAEWDRDRFFSTIPGSPAELAIVQEFQFGNVLVPASHFVPPAK